mmetsp:Transcript_22664/g.20149  ORF Transcript_22664/g.20149 Transcript_22664/m.20149 type:complete len:94 (-) Transcript_22664:52-333(-)
MKKSEEMKVDQIAYLFNYRRKSKKSKKEKSSKKDKKVKPLIIDFEKERELNRLKKMQNRIKKIEDPLEDVWVHQTLQVEPQKKYSETESDKSC